MGMRRSQNGELFQQHRLVVDMDSVYLVANNVLLRGHLFASIEKFGSHL